MITEAEELTLGRCLPKQIDPNLYCMQTNLLVLENDRDFCILQFYFILPKSTLPRPCELLGGDLVSFGFRIMR